MGGSKLSNILLCNLVALPQKLTALRKKHTVKTKPKKKKNHRLPFLAIYKAFMDILASEMKENSP